MHGAVLGMVELGARKVDLVLGQTEMVLKYWVPRIDQEWCPGYQRRRGPHHYLSVGEVAALLGNSQVQLGLLGDKFLPLEGLPYVDFLHIPPLGG